LWPYYERDVDAGRLTEEKAADLLANALILWGMKTVVPVGITQEETHQFSYASTASTWAASTETVTMPPMS